METNLKRKPLSSPLSGLERVGSGGKGLMNLEWNRLGVIDNDSGGDETDEMNSGVNRVTDSVVSEQREVTSNTCFLTAAL